MSGAWPSRQLTLTLSSQRGQTILITDTSDPMLSTLYGIGLNYPWPNPVGGACGQRGLPTDPMSVHYNHQQRKHIIPFWMYSMQSDINEVY